MIYSIHRQKKERRYSADTMNASMKRTTRIAQALTLVLLAGLVALAICLPWLLRGYISKFAYENTTVSSASFGIVLTLCYCVLIPGFFAGGLMAGLLRRVSRGLIFAAPSALIIRLIAICCFAECAIFALFTVYFTVSLGISFCALFLGIALLVVASVIDVGTEIKTENDYTV